jgi:hypothetical protein
MLYAREKSAEHYELLIISSRSLVPNLGHIPQNARDGEVRHFLENTIGIKHILIVFINENHVSAFRIVSLKHGDEAAGFTMAKTLGTEDVHVVAIFFDASETKEEW